MGRIHAVLIRLPDTICTRDHPITLPPGHLLELAAFFPDAYDLDLIDLNVERLSRRRLSGASFVYVSALESQEALLEHLVSACNRLGLPVAAGGELIDRSEKARIGVTWCILGEGVTTLSDFTEDYLEGKTAPSYTARHAQNLEGVRGPRYDLIARRHYPRRTRSSFPDFARDIFRGFKRTLASRPETV
jgi:hypothetical protein